jgi:hypothetical protein
MNFKLKLSDTDQPDKFAFLTVYNGGQELYDDIFSGSRYRFFNMSVSKGQVTDFVSLNYSRSTGSLMTPISIDKKANPYTDRI